MPKLSKTTLELIRRKLQKPITDPPEMLSKVTTESCKACEGSGRSSKGRVCFPCNGKGKINID